MKATLSHIRKAAAMKVCGHKKDAKRDYSRNVRRIIKASVPVPAPEPQDETPFWSDWT